jgi:membrane protein CcdC involved in cytochrome C biogenesis
MSLALLATDAEAALQLNIIVPVVMSCALLWWVSRSMSWTARLVVTAITLAIIIAVVLFERSGL